MKYFTLFSSFVFLFIGISSILINYTFYETKDKPVINIDYIDPHRKFTKDEVAKIILRTDSVINKSNKFITLLSSMLIISGFINFFLAFKILVEKKV